MTTKHTHTHRGHCQLCLRVHALDMTTGTVAKHGYTIPDGYFVGECPGSDRHSLHIERKLTDAAIEDAEGRARSMRKHIAKLEAGTETPARAWSGRYVRVEHKSRRSGQTYTTTEQELVPFAEAPAHYQADAVKGEIYKYDSFARAAEHRVEVLTKWAADIFDSKVPAYRVDEIEPTQWSVGDTLRIGGKKGFDAKIEAIEERDYKTVGFRRGSQTVRTPHALVTYPAKPEKRSKPDKYDPEGYVIEKAREERKVWEPLRNFKRTETKLAAVLKKAGLL